MTERTLILEIALPDFYLDDWDEELRFYVEHEMGDDAPMEMLHDTGLCSHRINVSILHGDKGGTHIERVRGQLVGAKVVPRAPEHELSDDPRYDEMAETERDTT